MNTCLTHGQSYPQDGYCVYCGPPSFQTVTDLVGTKHVCVPAAGSSGTGCVICGRFIQPYPPPQITWTTTWATSLANQGYTV